ncbi:MAG: hypothetical protein P8Z30_06775 [Acidobacteriota bacterium]
MNILFWALFIPGATLAGAQKTTFLNLAQTPKWEVESSRAVSLNDVRSWGVEPAVDVEYGVKKVEIRTYRRDKRTLQTVVEKTPDPSSAYGLLTFYQDKSMAPVHGMKLTVAGPDQAYMARGLFFVRVRRPEKSKMSGAEFRAALIAIAGAAPSADDMQLLPPSLPPQGMIPLSEKYVLGPVAEQRAIPSIPANLVGFQQGAELQAATYRRHGQQATLVLISYPTTQISRIHYSAMVQALGVNQKSGPGAVYGKRKATYILLVQNAGSKEIASRLMSGLTIKEQFSWDQPPPGKPITVQVFHLILGNILLVILLALMAVLAGVILVFSRRVAAKLFPNSDWARAYEDSIIRLNLK